MSYTAAEAIEYTTALMQQTQEVRDEAKNYEKIHGMYLLPKLPTDLERDDAMYVLSPDVIDEAKKLKARIMTFETEIKCLATRRTNAGTIADADQKAVDHMEKAAAAFLSNLDPRLVLLSRIIDGQLIEPLSIVVLELMAITSSEPSERFPWRAYDVDFDSCGWEETQGVPTVFGRRYSEVLRRTEKEYSKRKDGPQGPDADLYWAGDKWAWRKASDDFTLQTGAPALTNAFLARCDKVWLDDGEEIVHVVMNNPTDGYQSGPVRSGPTVSQSGEIAWSGPNSFGRVSAFLIGSDVRKARLMRDRYLPYMLPLITVTAQENVNLSTRATAARNRAAPRDYINADPDSLQMQISANGGKWPEPVEWADGKTPYLPGKLESRSVDIDPDMDKVDNRLTERRQRYTSGASTTLRDADVLKNSTLGSVLAAYDAENADLSIVVGPNDTFRRDVIEAWVHSVRWMADPKNSRPGSAAGPQYAKFELMANGGERASKSYLKAGDAFEVTKDTFETPHKWQVVTRQRSRGQATAEFEAAVQRFTTLPNGMPNIGVIDDLMEAAGISDIAERKSQLAVEAIEFEVLSPANKDWITRTLAFEIEKDMGIPAEFLLGPAAAPPPALPGVPGQQPPIGAEQNSPVTEPTQGGSGPQFIAG